jgi:hypothetical protein
VSEPPSPPSRPSDTPDRRIRRAWWIFAVSFFILGLIAVLRLATEDARPIDWAIVGLVFVVGYAAVRSPGRLRLEVGRRGGQMFADHVEPVAPVSPDAVLDAIVTELAEATGPTISSSPRAARRLC